MKKIALVTAPIGVALFGLVSAAHAQITTSTLGTAIDDLNASTYDMFQVLLAKYWPFVLGFIILAAVWLFGKRILAHFR